MTRANRRKRQKSRQDAGGTEWQLRRWLLLGLFEALPLASVEHPARQTREVRPARLAFASLGDVAFGEFGAFAEEKLLHLLFHDFLRIGIEGIQAVLVHDHF
jgi:hypothetical protein